MVESGFEPSQVNYRAHVLYQSCSTTSDSNYFQHHDFSSLKLRERIEEASLVKVLADLFSGRKIPLHYTNNEMVMEVKHCSFPIPSLIELESVESGCGCPSSQYFKPQEWQKMMVINKA